MDELDKKLLNELQRSGYQKASILALSLGVGERTIRRRLNAFVSKGIIKAVAIPKPTLLGFHAWAHIGIVVKPGALRKVARQLVDNPSIYFVAYCIGRFNFIVTVSFDTIDHLIYFVNTELTNMDGVRRTETMLIAKHRKYYHFYWPETDLYDSRNTRQNYPEDDYELDAIDRSILDVLMEDGLCHPVTIKTKLGMSESTIRKRINKMLKNDAFRIEVIPNLAILKERIWADIGLVIENNSSAHKVIDSIISKQAVHGIASVLGRYDIMMGGTFKDIDSLNSFVNNVLSEIEGVSSIDIYILAGPLKYYRINWYDSYHLAKDT